jgi:hypothetical protein
MHNIFNDIYPTTRKAVNRRKKKDRLAAVSPKFDQVFFRSGGCESGGGVPLRASKADETKPGDPG